MSHIYTIRARNKVDAKGRPAGGYAEGVGFQIRWQDGPMRGEDFQHAEPNGAFVEAVLQAVWQRIQHYQESPFACDENADAMRYIDAALDALNRRTARREAAGVEETHGVMHGERGV